jgi:hypothetical protein
VRAYTFTQAAADEVDCGLSSCAHKAEFMSEKASLSVHERTTWRAAFDAIETARCLVRDMMHPETRDETIEP